VVDVVARHAEVEVTRLLEDLTPAATEAEELERAQRQYLHTQSILDGQGLKFWGQTWGVDAALTDQTMRNAAPAPVAAEVDADGVPIARPTVHDGHTINHRSAGPTCVKSQLGHRPDTAAVRVSTSSCRDGNCRRASSSREPTIAQSSSFAAIWSNTE
jgi:hypothetical protein